MATKRGEVLTAIQENPGCGLRQLSRRTGLSTDTIAGHLGALRGMGRIEVRKHGNTNLMYPAGEAPDHVELLLAGEPHLQELLDFLKRQAPIRQARVLEWARSRGWARSTTQWRMQRLVGHGLACESRLPLGRMVYAAK